MIFNYNIILIGIKLINQPNNIMYDYFIKQDKYYIKDVKAFNFETVK